MEIRVRNFDSFDEAFRYLLRGLEVHEKLVPFLAEKTNAFNLLGKTFQRNI